MALPRNSDQLAIQRLRNQFRWMTSLSTAISTPGSGLDEIYSIVLAGLIAPTGLGYSQVLFFEYDTAECVLVGRFGIFHESREVMQALYEELDAEEQYMETQYEALHQAHSEGAPNRPDEEQELHWLSNTAQWITLLQRLNPDNAVTEQIQKLVFPARPGKGAGDNLFEELGTWKGPRRMSKAKVGRRLPPAVAALLPEHFAIAPLISNKGLRAIVFVDRHLEGDEPITRQELRELEWFCRQSALAMENVEINQDLARTYLELKQLDQMKSNFLSIISHELRTPLTAMSGFVDLLLEERVGSINENQRTLLSRVQKNTGHLGQLVDDLIQLAEIEAEGAIDLRLMPVEPLGVLIDTLPKLEQRRRSKNVRVVPVIDGEVPRIHCDERALGRIFFHLLDNALKFSNDQSTVEVRFSVVDGEFHASITDHGVGIARENLQHIFKQFYQVDGSLTRGHEGLGLGLAVTKMLTEATRGRVEVQSELGQGSTFTVIYPIVTVR